MVTPAELKKMREKLGFTQVELAHALDVSVNTIWKWETGRVEPRGRHLEAFYSLLVTAPQTVEALETVAKLGAAKVTCQASATILRMMDELEDAMLSQLVNEALGKLDRIEELLSERLQEQLSAA